MEVPYRHGCDRALFAALALILLTMAMSTGLLEILQQKEESSFLRPSVLNDKQWQLWAAGRRRLAGPGSSPPICRSRCGDCFPCRPIHVAIQQGQSIPLEYYPEAWRCKCRDKFFIP